MDVNMSPYLEAIQAISGLTPGKKYRELNSIAKRAATDEKSRGEGDPSPMSVEDVPEPLVPLVRLEIGKILRHNREVIEALKSEDSQIVDRALRSDWFFRSDNRDVVNVEYFRAHLLPVVSLNTRLKLIKRIIASFSSNRDTVLAQQFYFLMLESYGKRQAEPLLVACDESFVWDTINQQKIVLSARTIQILFVKYPQMIIRYLKLFAPASDSDDSKKSHRVDIRKYASFLPRLIKKHLVSFIELIEMHNSCWDIKLSNKATERFLKSNVDVVLEKPTLYTCMMPLKVIAAKITKSQYRCMFARAFPPKLKNFNYYEIRKYLEYCPKRERITLLLETYEKIYAENMLDNHDLIDENIICMLPADERARQARLKLVEEPNWREARWQISRAWRCYLPMEETISSIKTEISKTSVSNDRTVLLQQLLYVCRINDDNDELLRVLRYITLRHRNERADMIFEVLDELAQLFDVMSFGRDHWSIINDFMKFLHVKNELVARPTISIKILISSIHFDLLHELSIDERIEILIDINMKVWNCNWCLFEKYPVYDRACFDLMMSIIPRKYPKNNKIWSAWGLDGLSSVVKSILDFNNRNNGKIIDGREIEKLSIKNYDWLLDATEKAFKKKRSSEEWKLVSIIDYLRIYEIDLYDRWIPVKPEIIGDVTTTMALNILRQDSRKILARCDEYLALIKMSVSSAALTRRFVRACRWYQDIPMKFFSRCLKNVSEDRNEDALLILALLMNGTEFSRLIEPLVPAINEESIDTSSESAKSTYALILKIPRAMNLADPPVELDLVGRLCCGEFLNIALAALTNASRRARIDKIEKLARRLIDSRVSVKKHGIRILCLVSMIADYRDLLSSLWQTEKHRSIRQVIFMFVHRIFVADGCPENWTLLSDCMNELRIDDDEAIIDCIVDFRIITKSRIVDYVPQTLDTLVRLEADGYDAKRMALHIEQFLRRIDESTSKSLTNEFSERLFRTYFCNASHPWNLTEAGMHYTLNVYLRADETKLEQRLKIFREHYAELLVKYWNKPDIQVSTYFPINWMTHSFVHNCVIYADVDEKNVKIMKTILESFMDVLKPQQDWTTCAMLTFGMALHDAKEATIVAERIADTLPHLVEILGPHLVIEFAGVVEKWLTILIDHEVYDDTMYGVIETLCRMSTLDSCILAAKLLFRSSDRQYDERRNEIVELLQNSQYPVVVSLACEHVNTCNFPA